VELKRDVNLGLGALVLAVVITCAGAISMLTRMSPAIEWILTANVYSEQEAEQMLTLLALSDLDPQPDTLPQRFSDSLQRARSNITESEEQAVLDAIERQATAALAGDPEARRAVVAELGRLTTINRDAMRRADDEAQRLGTAGAWAMVLLGLIGFVTSLVVTRRLRRRIVEPVEELYDVLSSVADGDLHRRCHVPATSAELAFALRSVNDLLDQRLRQRFETSRGEPSLAPPSQRHLPASG